MMTPEPVIPSDDKDLAGPAEGSEDPAGPIAGTGQRSGGKQPCTH